MHNHATYCNPCHRWDSVIQCGGRKFGLELDQWQILFIAVDFGSDIEVALAQTGTGPYPALGEVGGEPGPMCDVLWDSMREQQRKEVNDYWPKAAYR